MGTNVSDQMNDFNKKKWEQLKGDYGDIVVKQIREILESNTTTTKDKLIEIFLNSKGRTPKDKELFHIILQLKEPKEEIERTEVGKEILKGFNILVGVYKVADGVTKLLAMRQNDKELQACRQKIAELEAKGDLTKTDRENLELCRQELDRLMLEGAEQGLSMMSELADYIPVIGPYIREQIDLGIEVMKVGAELVMAHKKQIQEAIDWMNGNSGTVTEEELKNRIPSNKKLYSQYLEYKALKETGIMDIVMQGADKNKKKKYQKNLSHFENDWNELEGLIGQLNGKLKSLAKTKEPWEKVETFYQYDLEKGLEKVKDAQGDVTRPYDPLVVDLNHNGFDLHSVENGVYFDLDNNGTKEKTSWVDKQDGFLVMDQNGNGKIDTGAELFGEKVLLKNGQYSNGAIDVLSEFDENGDGIIDDKDSVFDKLMIWQDLNHNGISEEGELKTLKEHHIVGLKLTDI